MTAVPSFRPSLNRLSRFDRQLWNRFVAIAQPYWYPSAPNSGKAFFGLLALLIVFLFALLFLLVSGGVLLLQAIFPDFMSNTAGGLVGIVQAVFGSPLIGIVLAALLIPLLVFWLVRRQILPRWPQWAFLGVLLLLSLAVSGMNVIISYVGNFFTTALSERDVSTFWRFFFVYAGVFVAATPIVVFYGYTQELLGLRWRDWMTQKFLDKYFHKRAYYEINFEEDIDNPDQRIAEDIKSFTATSLTFLLLLLGAVIDVISFTGILWSISSFLAIFLISYAVVGTAVAGLFGRKLITLNFNQLKREADFRYGLVHVRDNAESIAFYQGEAQEQGQLRRRFVEVLRNFNFLIGWQRNLAFFRTPYRYATYILPSVILAPMYFNEQIRFGDISQAGFAFSQIFEAFALVVLQINQLSAFAAGINRLETFTEALDAQDQPLAELTNAIQTRTDDQIILDQVSLSTPKGQRTLLKQLSLELQPEQSLVIVGQSGVGKSSLLRAIAGLWNTGTGHITRPDLAKMLFLPQRPYMVLGTLREQLLYPRVNREINETKLIDVLQQANLADLPDRIGGFEIELDWADVLSLGEQQRLAFARLLLARPRYAILDEATSALDLTNERFLYAKLRDIGITYVSVGHRASLLKHHDFVLELNPNGTWELIPTQHYAINDEAFV
ncbi:MAG: ABC transporter ATP-binding protein/permease [Elainella sp. Prado103]|jgi:putative ATP-binding cassette transporter|nr:ABC transporter ATP-binding protein/permease [Elainella sp. Prado103]